MASKNKEELLVKRFLDRKGFVTSEIKRNCTNGVDIVAIKEGKAFRIEVKKAFFTSGQWRINKVHPSGKTCELIAIVIKEQIIFQPMSDHLKLCGKNGCRSITGIINFSTLVES